MSKFGILGNIEFFQNFTSNIISKLNPAVIHNVGKYLALKKAFYLSAIDSIKGDYHEFGIFKGSSFTHAIRCAKNNIKFDENLSKMMFYGFDSFEGFGQLDELEKHSFYTDINFKTSYDKVFKRVNKIIDKSRFSIINGFFEETLNKKILSKKSRIAFIDSDTYSSAYLALNYLIPALQEGTILILDDYFSYSGSYEKGVCGAFKKFTNDNDILTRTIFNYGMGGSVKIVIKM